MQVPHLLALGSSDGMTVAVAGDHGQATLAGYEHALRKAGRGVDPSLVRYAASGAAFRFMDSVGTPDGHFAAR